MDRSEEKLEKPGNQRHSHWITPNSPTMLASFFHRQSILDATKPHNHDKSYLSPLELLYRQPQNAKLYPPHSFVFCFWKTVAYHPILALRQEGICLRKQFFMPFFNALWLQVPLINCNLAGANPHFPSVVN